MPRIHILGASGSGVSTLGGAVAAAIEVPQVDSDAVFWLPTEPPFQSARPLAERLALLLRQLPRDGDWVFSGSAISWAKPLEPCYELIVYLRVDPSLRMGRLRARERERYGHRIGAGGDMADASSAFLRWAAAYDTAGPEQRSRIAHEQWLARQAAPVLRLDSSAPVEVLTAAVVAAASPGDSVSNA